MVTASAVTPRKIAWRVRRCEPTKPDPCFRHFLSKPPAHGWPLSPARPSGRPLADFQQPLTRHLGPIKAIGIRRITPSSAAQFRPETRGLTPFHALTIGPPACEAAGGRDNDNAQARSGKCFETQGFSMSRRCELTGKSAQVGHKVSHSNIKTKRRFLPNLLNVTMISDALGRSVKLRVSANALKTVDHRGGLDAFLLKAKDDDLSEKALELKRQIRKKRAAAAG